MDSTAYNESTKSGQRFHEEVNTVENYHTIIEAIKSGRSRDLSFEPKAETIPEKMPAIIVGSGPSLDHSIKFLKNWKGGIFCSTSQVKTLMYHGIEPTHIVALDIFSMWSEVEGFDWAKTRTKLITHPGVHSSLVTKWPNEILLYVQSDGKSDSFHCMQKRMYSYREGDLRFPTFHYYIISEIPVFACSPPAQIISAQLLGYGTLFLCGLDFGCPGGKERATMYDFDENGKWKEIVFTQPPAIDAEDGYTKSRVISNNGIPTYEIQIFYKKNFLSSWRLGKQTMYSTDHGILLEVPYTDIQKVVKKQGYGYQHQSKYYISKSVEPYLASVGLFVIETENGEAFVECENPEKDLIAFMTGINSRYVCNKCGNKILLKDAEGAVCTNCKNGQYVREVFVDIDKNMERISKMLKLSEKYKVTHNGV